MAKNLGTLVNPEAVRVGRHVDENGDWIVSTFETEYDGQEAEFVVAIEPTKYVSFIVAALNALGYPEGDCEYIAARWARENSAAK